MHRLQPRDVRSYQRTVDVHDVPCRPVQLGAKPVVVQCVCGGAVQSRWQRVVCDVWQWAVLGCKRWFVCGVCRGSVQQRWRIVVHGVYSG